MVIRTSPFLLALALAAATVVGATARPASAVPARIVPCQEIIDHPNFPYTANPSSRYRLVLGFVSAPPAFLGQPVALHEQPWPYWLKTLLVIKPAHRWSASASRSDGRPAWQSSGATATTTPAAPSRSPAVAGPTQVSATPTQAASTFAPARPAYPWSSALETEARPYASGSADAVAKSARRTSAIAI
jgi:hypothetical protein